MKPSLLIKIVIAVLAIGGIAFVFLTNASPYVTVAQAKKMEGKNLHLAGALDKSSLDFDYNRQMVRFNLTDDEGKTVQVVHQGIPEGNIQEAVRVVAIGGMEGDVFVAEDMLLKCPSKYESKGSEAESSPQAVR